MSQIPNPYSSPQVPSDTAVSKPGRGGRIFPLLVIALAGICLGSYVSAELHYFHFPAEARTPSRVIQDTTRAITTSPISMTLGVMPTLGFYGKHGILVVPGFFLALIGCIAYYRNAAPVFLVIAFIGFTLWSHNNHLSFQALMSV